MESVIINKIGNKLAKINSVDIFQSALPTDLNIYGQAHLENESALLIQNSIQNISDNELGVHFDLSGEISGTVNCLINTKNKNIPEKEDSFFKSLFVESMNIFTGQMVTNIENSFDMNTMISNPRFINQSLIKALPIDSDNLLLTADYKFITIHDEFDCRILIEIQNK